MFRELARARANMRDRDVAESKLLLWELVTHEPTVLRCFGIVEATCLAQVRAPLLRPTAAPPASDRARRGCSAR